MKLNKDQLITYINKIRKEIGHDETDISIKEIILNENNKELWIITYDRPNKSAIIGKGGWVVGRLREELGLGKIHVESYSDYLLKKYQMKLSLNKINSILNEVNKINTINNINKINKIDESDESDKSNDANEANENITKITYPLNNLKEILELKINNLYEFNLNYNLNFNFDFDFDLNRNITNTNTNLNTNLNINTNINVNTNNNANNNTNVNANADSNVDNDVNENNKYHEENIKNSSEHLAIVALSGGADSSFSLILAKYLGFNPIAITIDPGTIVLPNQFKKNIKNLCEKLEIEHKYLKIDYSEIIDNALNGKYHPCGRCSKLIEKTLFDYGAKIGVPIVIFGDMLSTGTQCITTFKNSTKKEKISDFNSDNSYKHKEYDNDTNYNNYDKYENYNNYENYENYDKYDKYENYNNYENYENYDKYDKYENYDNYNKEYNLYRLNLPATLSISKEEIKEVVKNFGFEEIPGFGCPLLFEVHKKYPHMKKFSIQRILRETRSGALEPGESLDLIWSFYKN